MANIEQLPVSTIQTDDNRTYKTSESNNDTETHIEEYVVEKSKGTTKPVVNDVGAKERRKSSRLLGLASARINVKDTVKDVSVNMDATVATRRKSKRLMSMSSTTHDISPVSSGKMNESNQDIL